MVDEICLRITASKLSIRVSANMLDALQNGDRRNSIVVVLLYLTYNVLIRFIF